MKCQCKVQGETKPNPDGIVGGNVEYTIKFCAIHSAAPIGAELAKAVLASFGLVTADGPTPVSATKAEVLAIVALAREFQKQTGGQ
jgi:hypothetical protein